MGAKNVVFVMPMRQMNLIFLSCSFAKKLCGALVSLPTIFPHPPISKYVWK
jgi:hypothetical protein